MSLPSHHIETKIERGLKEFIDAGSAGLIPATYTGFRAEELPLPRVDIVVTEAEAVLWAPALYQVTVEITLRHDQNAIGSLTVDQSSTHDTAWGQLCDVLNTIPINVNPFNAGNESTGLAYAVTVEQGSAKSMQIDAAREVSRRRFMDGKVLCSMATWELIANALGSSYGI